MPDVEELQGQAPGATGPEASAPQGDAPEQPVAATEPVTPEAAAQPPVDLDSLPQFRRWKSSMDQKVAELQKQGQEQARQVEQHYRQQVAEVQRQMDEARMAGMDDDERRVYDAQRRARLAEERAKQLEEESRKTQEAWQQLVQQAEYNRSVYDYYRRHGVPDSVLATHTQDASAMQDAVMRHFTGKKPGQGTPRQPAQGGHVTGNRPSGAPPVPSWRDIEGGTAVSDEDALKKTAAYLEEIERRANRGERITDDQLPR